MENKDNAPRKRTLLGLLATLYVGLKTVIVYFLLPYKMRRYRYRILDIIEMGISPKSFQKQLLVFKLYYFGSAIYLFGSSYLAYDYITNSNYIDYEIKKVKQEISTQVAQNKGLTWIKPAIINSIENLSEDTKIDLKAFVFLLSIGLGGSFISSTLINRRLFYSRKTKSLKKSLVRYGMVKEDEIKTNNSLVTPVGILIDAQDKTKDELKKNEVFWKQMGVTPGDIKEHPTFNSYYFVKGGLKLGDTKQEISKWVYDFTNLK